MRGHRPGQVCQPTLTPAYLRRGARGALLLALMLVAALVAGCRAPAPPQPAATPAASPTAAIAARAEATATAPPTPTASPTASLTATSTPTRPPTATATASPTPPPPTSTPAPEPTATATATATATLNPTATPSRAPTLTRPPPPPTAPPYRFLPAGPAQPDLSHPCPGCPLAPAFIVGRVVDAAGNPLAGVRLVCYNEWHRYPVIASKDGGEYDFNITQADTTWYVVVLDENDAPLSPEAPVPFRVDESCRYILDWRRAD